MLLIGHLDTVFERDSPFQKFQRIDDKTAKGPGIIDMKGGDVIIIAALKALKAAGAARRHERRRGHDGRRGGFRAIRRRPRAPRSSSAAKGAQYALGFEDGPGGSEVRRHRAPRHLVVEAARSRRRPGTRRRSSASDIGYGANYELARILDGFRRKLAGEAHLTFNPSLVLGGTALEIDEVLSKGSASGKDERDRGARGRDRRPADAVEGAAAARRATR